MYSRLLGIALTLLSTFSCSYISREVDPRLVPFIVSFETVCKVKWYGSATVDDTRNWKYSWLPRPICGYCNPITGTIVIDSRCKLTEDLVWHELGHCALSRWKHTEGTLEDGCPRSTMDPRPLHSQCWEEHRNYYIKELCP